MNCHAVIDYKCLCPHPSNKVDEGQNMYRMFVSTPIKQWRGGTSLAKKVERMDKICIDKGPRTPKII